MRLLRWAVAAALAVVVTAVAFDFLAPETSAGLLFALDRRQSGLVAKRIDVGGLDIAYLEGGVGEPLLLVHGFGADKDNFVRVARYLTPRYRVLIPDLPGFGESARPDGVSYAVAVQAERLWAFAGAVGAPTVHLGGNSMGGFVVTEYALAHPGEVASLWLLAPAGTAVGFDNEISRAIVRGGPNPLLSPTPEDFPRTLALVMADVPFMPYSIRHTLSVRAARDYPLHRKIFDEVGPPRAPTLDARLRGLATPALVVWGTDDRALSPAAAAVYDAAMPNAEVVRMDGVGHLPMLERPVEAARDYLAFRDRLAAAP